MMKLFKDFWYSLLLEYHFNASKKFEDYEHPHHYHNQKGKHYYRLVHGREYKD